MAEPEHERYVFYYYSPSVPAGAIFTAIFFLSALVHGAQIVRKRTWYFIPMLVGALLEGGGYVGRIISHRDVWALTPYLINTLFLLVAPALLAASVYIVLGRLMLHVDGAHYSIVPVRWVTKLFVTGDVISFFLQSAGGGLMGSGKPEMLDVGEKVILGGLWVQIVFFGFFIIVSILFDWRIRKNPTERSQELLMKSERHRVFGFEKNWKLLLKMLYASSALILVRSVFRVVEYIQGNDGYLISHEVFLYVFDGLLMAGVCVGLNVVHPTDVLEAEVGKKEGMEMEWTQSQEPVNGQGKTATGAAATAV